MFTIRKSVHEMWSISGEVSKEVAQLVRSVISNGYMSSEEYKLRTESRAFLQCDVDDYILVEFWTKDMKTIRAFVDYLNERIAKL